MQIKSLSAIISLALQEDNAYNDVTSDFTINEQQENNFSIVARQDMILSGINVLEETFLQLKKK